MPTHNRIPDATRQQIADRYAEIKNGKTVGREFGVKGTTVLRIAREHGIEVPSRAKDPNQRPIRTAEAIERNGGTRPLCDCHNEEMYWTAADKPNGGYWRCAVVNRKKVSAYGKSAKGRERDRKRKKLRHGRPHYSRYCSMVGRCHKPSDKAFHSYGARGIRVCEEWAPNGKTSEAGFATFLADISKLEHFGEPEYSLDRIDNDKGYEPGNVRWATAEEQRDNTRPYIALRRQPELLARITELEDRRGDVMLFELDLPALDDTEAWDEVA